MGLFLLILLITLIKRNMILSKVQCAVMGTVLVSELFMVQAHSLHEQMIY